MADLKISALTSAGALAGTEPLPIVQGGSTKKTTVQDIANLAAAGIPHATASGTDTYTATITGVASYTDADAYLIRFTNGNTSAATLNINSLGAKALYRNNDGAIIGGDIWDGGEMLCIYNSTLNAFKCIGTSPNSIFAYITNADSVTITKGQVVYAFGGTGDRMTVKLANNTSDATSARTVGVVLSTSIAANQKGIIILQGLLDGLSILPTATYTDGDSIYLGATAGSITNVKQYAPNHLVYVATVTTASNGTAGRMYVRIQNGYEMDELHDVSAQTPANKNGLFFNSSNSLWEARAVAATDIDANVSNTEFGYLDGVSSSIQTQLNTKVTFFASGADGAANAASSTANTISISVLIPANTFALDDVIRINHRIRVSGVAAIRETRVYANTSASLTGAILVSTATLTSTTLAANLQRFLAIKNATTNTEVVSATTSLLTDYNSVPSPASVTTLAINWTVDQYIIFAVNATGTGADSIRATMYSIEKL
jgi:hypothetical protein